MERQIGIPGAETGQRSVLAAMVSRLPDHVRDSYYAPHPRVDGLHRLVSSLFEDAPEISDQSKITPEELLQVNRLEQFQSAFESAIPREGNEQTVAFRKEYRDLRDSNELTDPDRGMKGLALAIVSRQRTSTDTDHPIEITLTQKIALVRSLHALQNDDSRGLFTELRSGGGKTSVLIPTLIPVALLYGKHIDVVSLTPKSRLGNIATFRPMAKQLGITASQLTPEDADFFYPDKAAARSVPVQDGAMKALTETDVTFALRDSIGHTLERHPELGNKTTGEKVVLFQDEFDGTDLDTFSTDHYAIGIHPVPTMETLDIQWQPLAYPTGTTDTGKQYGFPDHDAFSARADLVMQWLIRTVDTNPTESGVIKDMFRKGAQLDAAWIRHHIGDQDIGGKNLADALASGNKIDPNFFAGFRLMQKFFEHYERVVDRAKDPLPHAEKYLGPRGEILAGAEEDIFRRMWAEAAGTPYDENVILPANRKRFFETVFPPHVILAFNEAIKVRNNSFIDGNGMVSVKDEFTGFPRERTMFEPMTQLALTAWYSLHERVSLPPVLQDFQDVITPDEVTAVRYDKILGFSGTGAGKADWFKRVHKMETTVVPPHFKERFEPLPIELFPDSETKWEGILRTTGSFIDRGNPVLIDTTTETEWQQLHDRMRSLGPNVTVRAVQAKNAAEAMEIFEAAGQQNTVTIALLMDGREIDIPVSDEANRAGGLVVIGASPRTTRRNGQQRDLRTSRNGNPGVSVEFSCPDDAVFDNLTQPERRRLANAAQTAASPAAAERDRAKARRQYEDLLDTATTKHEADLDFRNEQALERAMLFVDIRKQLARLPPEQRERIMDIWGVFRVTVETKLGLIDMDGTAGNQPHENRARMYQAQVGDLFGHLVRYAEEGTGFRHRAKARIRWFATGHKKDVPSRKKTIPAGDEGLIS